MRKRNALLSVVTVVALIWRLVLIPEGGLAAVIAGAIGRQPVAFLSEQAFAMPAVALTTIWWGIGLPMVLFLAALQGVPRELYEAARVDGASRWTQFHAITLPLISPTVLLTMIITIVGSLQIFAQIAVLTQGGPGMSTTVLVYYLFQQAFQFHRFGYGSTIAILLFVIVAALTFAQWQLRRKLVFYES